MHATRPPLTRAGLAGIAAPLVLMLAGGSARAQDPVARSYQRSYALEAAGKKGAALRSLQQIPGSQRGTYFYQIRLGWLLYLNGKHGKAVAAYRRATARSPRAVEPWLGLMLPQMAARRWKDAEVTARKVMRMAPKNFLASTRLAWILYNLGRYYESERVYRRVLQLYPANLTMRAGLGWSLLKQQKVVDAAAEFKAVLQVSPKNKSALDGLNTLDKQQTPKRKEDAEGPVGLLEVGAHEQSCALNTSIWQKHTKRS